LGAAHGSYLAAVNLALCLHIIDSYKPLRGCLEAAVYALHVERDMTAYVRWKERPLVSTLSSDSATRKVQVKLRYEISGEFSVAKISKTIANSNLRTHVETLYNETIDLGAHYNFPAFLQGFEIVDYNNSQVKSLILNSSESAYVSCF